MRVLILESHPTWIHGLSSGFRDLGHDVKISGPISEGNIALLFDRFEPELAICMGWTDEHSEEKRVWIREHVVRAGIPLVYWATEDPTHTERWSIPLITDLKPHFVFTICQDRVDFYQKKGISAAHMDFGYHHSVNFPAPFEQRFAASIAVVANAYPDVMNSFSRHFRHQSMQTLIYPLLEKGIRVDFWGKEWERMIPFGKRAIHAEWIHGELHFTNTNKIYRCSDIILGIQNHLTQLTQRTYEILGSGGFLLTMDTPEIRRLFKPGHDLVVSSSPEETVRLVEYYQNHPEEREKIRKNGRETVANHSYRHRAEYMIRVLQKEKILPNDMDVNAQKNKTDDEDNHQDWEIYSVERRDFLASIANRFNITEEEIIKANDLVSDWLYIGQKLRIYKK